MKDAKERLRGDAQGSTHAEIERELGRRGFELMRRPYQAHLDERLLMEHAALELDGAPAEVETRVRERDLEATFGEVKVRRHGFKAPGKAAHFPMDAALHLPN